MIMSDVHLEDTLERYQISYLYVLFASFNLGYNIYLVLNYFCFEYIPWKMQDKKKKKNLAIMEKELLKIQENRGELVHQYPLDKSYAQYYVFIWELLVYRKLRVVFEEKRT